MTDQEIFNLTLNEAASREMVYGEEMQEGQGRKLN